MKSADLFLSCLFWGRGSVFLKHVKCFLVGHCGFQYNFRIKNYVRHSLYCDCGLAREDAFHVFFECNKYAYYTKMLKGFAYMLQRFRMLIDIALITSDNQDLTNNDYYKSLDNFTSLLEDSKDFIWILPRWSPCPQKKKNIHLFFPFCPNLLHYIMEFNSILCEFMDV